MLALLTLSLDGIFRVFAGRIAGRIARLRLLLVGSCRAQEPILLREGTLRSELLALEFLDSILEFGNLRFVYFNWEWLLHHGRTWRLLLLATRQPHNHDHQHGDSQDQPGLDVLRKQARRFRGFILNWLVHVLSLPPGFSLMAFSCAASTSASSFRQQSIRRRLPSARRRIRFQPRIW